MISFNLACEREHEFEGWFANSAAFETQRSDGLLECPVCGSHKVEKALSAPNIAASRSREAARAQEARRHAVMLAKFREAVEKTHENVGERFAEEARKIHYGETEERGIFGKATPEEVSELVEEGVPIAPLPWDDEDDRVKN